MKIDEKSMNDFFTIINKKKIRSVFQPIVSLQTGEILSFEALSRITLKSCSLNIEELFNIANKIEQAWKLDQLCRKSAIKASKHMPSNKKLFINVDANVLLDQDFVQGFTKEYLKKYDLDSNNIVFELSEKTSIEDRNLFKEAVKHYRSQGFEIAIDDAGAGYSNLNRISHIQPEYIKLDRELIQDIHLNKDKYAMVEVMVNYCKEMNYKLIGEGIETKEELECLIQLGVDYGQGYYLKKPVDDFDDIPKSIKNTIQELSNKHKQSLNKDTIELLCHFPCTLKNYQTLDEAYQLLINNENIQRIYVIDDNNHYLGYLKRENVLCELNLYHRLQTVEQVLLKDSFIVSCHLSIENTCQLYLQIKNSHFYEDIIVLKNQCFYGVVSVKNLLEFLLKK